VIVVDVGDSAAAPHQSTRDRLYYRREGGHSMPAPHFYLELLRQRLTNPVLDFELKGHGRLSATQHDNGIAISSSLIFLIHNVGRVATYEWQLSVRALNAESEIANERLRKDLHFEPYPPGLPQQVGVQINKTILPGCSHKEVQPIGLQLRPRARTRLAVREELKDLVQPLTLYYQLATETSPGEPRPISIGSLIDVEDILELIEQNCAAFFL
jgi:hypothetical protein